MKNALKSDNVNYISFEDQNTKGLSKDNYAKYAYHMGDHYVEEDSDLERMRGGSHGVGKIASNSASAIYLM